MEVYIFKWDVFDDDEKKMVFVGFGYTEKNEKVAVCVNDFVAKKYYSNSISPDTHKYKLRDVYYERLTGFNVVGHDSYKRFCSDNSPYNSRVDIITAFTTELQIHTVGWIRICDFKHNHFSKKTNREFEVTCSAKNISHISKSTVIQPSVMSFDIECASGNLMSFPNAYNIDDYISMIGIVFGESRYILVTSKINNVCNEKYKLLSYPDEYQLLKGFFDIVKTLDPDIIIGYNIYGFDFPYMARRIAIYLRDNLEASRITNLPSLYKVHTTMPHLKGGTGMTIYNPGRINIDLYACVSEMQLPSATLSYVSKKFLNNDKIDLPPSVMFNLIYEDTMESITTVADYCIHDAYLVQQLYEKLHYWIQLVEVSNISVTPIEDLYTNGQSQRYMNLLYKYCANSNVVLNKCAENIAPYRGATVLKPESGFYRKCTVLDFTSLYPSVIISNNICYTTYAGINIYTKDEGAFNIVKVGDKKYYFTKEYVGILPLMLKTLLEERVKYRKLCESSDGIDKIVYDKRQYALKIQANSVYGCLGLSFSEHLRFLPGAECTTGKGREYLKKSVDFITRNTPFDVIYGDTDSCLISCDYINNMDLFIKNSKEIGEVITEMLPEGIHLKYEDTFETLIMLSKKKYAGMSVLTNKKIIKGIESVKKSNSVFAKTLYNTLLDYMLSNRSYNEIYMLVYSSVRSLLRGEVPHEDLKMYATIGGPYKEKSYYIGRFIERMREQKYEYRKGDKVAFYIAKNGGRNMGDKMYNMETIGNLSLDYKYYFEKRIQPQVKKLLDTYDETMLEDIKLRIKNE